MSNEVPSPDQSEVAAPYISDERFARLLKWQGFMSDRMVEIKVAETSSQAERRKWLEYLQEQGYTESLEE